MTSNQKLKQLLAERGIKQSAVAKAIGMKVKTFNAILNCRAELKADTLIAVCRFIGADATIFFENKVQENWNKEAAHVGTARA